MSNPTLTKSRTAETEVIAFRLVKHGTSDGKVVQAAAATDAIMGVCSELGAAAGERVDVHLAGLAEVEFGGPITRGDPLTADADGKAVKAAPAAGDNVRIAGFADVSGVAGDIGIVLLAPGAIHGETA